MELSVFTSQAVLWLFALSATLVCVGSLLPAKWMPPIKHDKFAHFVAFGGMVLIARVLAANLNELAVWSAGLLIAGFCIELLQGFVPGRNFCWKDLLANAAGIGSGMLFCLLLEYTLAAN
ncbi:VanZ family protein [Undibacterium sp. Ji49W]|uniref:VanZ family protein n=1 Tax=Undibacterium sp. Ji49W TaxID=3413040 RepID=UPI003BF3E389